MTDANTKSPAPPVPAATILLIRDGEKKIETDDLKKVPEDYRAATEKLLKSVTRP